MKADPTLPAKTAPARKGPKLQRDFLGPFVECNGEINRPMTTTELACEEIVKASHVACTPTVRLLFKDGSRDVWHACGEASAYKRARQIMAPKEFEAYVAMAASFEVMSCGGIARKAYPEVAKLWPEGHVDYRSGRTREHLDLEKRLSFEAGAESAAKHSAKTAAPALPAADAPGAGPRVVKAISALVPSGGAKKSKAAAPSASKAKPKTKP